MKRCLLACVSLAALFAGSACGRGAEPGAAVHVPESADGAVEGRAVGASEVVVALAAGEQAAMALEFARLAPLELAREALTYGRIVSDPARSTTLRAPLAGTLLPGNAAWPGLGAHVEASTVVAHLAPRWTPQDRLDLAPRAVGARADLAALEAELPVMEAELERASSLNAAEKSVSDRELSEAQGRLAAQRARLAGARELLRILEAARESAEAPAPIAIRAGRDGEAVELLARPGEFVESGAALLRLEDFREPLCSIDLPLEGGVAEDVARARVQPSGVERILDAERVGVAPSASAAFRALLFRLNGAAELSLRPGLGLIAWLPLDQEPRKGVLVPRSAIVRVAGRGFVYTRRGTEELVRREVELSSPVEGGWFAEADWAEGAEVLVRGAASVLSYEMLGRQGAEEEE